MVDNVSPSASELLKQIQRLSAQSNKKTVNPSDAVSPFSNKFENNKINKGTGKIKNTPGQEKTKGSEKVQKKNNISVQKSEDMKTTTKEGYNSVNLKRIPYSKRLGSFLDTYF